MNRIGYWNAIVFAGPQAWGFALLEIFVVATVSLIPLLGAALRDVLPATSNIYLGDAFQKAFLSGQLIFYAIGLIATIVWQSNKDFSSFFPWRSFFNIFSLIGIVICSLVIGYDPTLTSISPPFLARCSLILFFLSLAAYTLMAVIAQVHVNVGQSLAEDDSALADEVRRSRGIH
ncbi:hypothetical protein QOV31_005185 (plasmid) [Agrobacterium fabrum]|uniref:hypothetical protein n=1 Tax=Rhizobium/Agrobacterium group TaxID=227290 RepID=UPI0004D62A9C|nr:MULTISPECIES: hypothetical protein [Rhizobium/Agrobacterium group]KEA04503.1 hypothetical protein CN09_19405 [Rhizobium rhizogenes]NMV72401.1 hypothetical protein [Agrobacterium fabrum]NTI85313.1 hypothetical protein [Rhizobium rhizogenes]NTJ27496.1 hypothetical protein [Rhizobium rhizogenes]QRM41886.1 hypothetical protein F3X89_29130 [Rhizobium rhizogenes]